MKVSNSNGIPTGADVMAGRGVQCKTLTNAFAAFLDDILVCFIEADLKKWRARLQLPFSLITKEGPTVLADDTAVEENFRFYLIACEAMSLDLVDRQIVSLEACPDGTWLGTFKTRLVSGFNLATEPYVSTALLHLQPDGSFRMSSMLNGRGHREWTGVSGR